ncbi:hypothetical protein D9613_010643 [Agrocybe pediades]|uniref:Uncharacterized protein n=1 Tax=Agrocybe pediades TaxID=84607 RepID=A0A8H4VJC5_9AGAR|nr:hypothetical protein D9613_010643 [Agrocybe pediades]
MSSFTTRDVSIRVSAGNAIEKIAERSNAGLERKRNEEGEEGSSFFNVPKKIVPSTSA